MTAARLLMVPRAGKGAVRLVESVPDGLPMLHGDERRVTQILLNLLSNAVKFTPAGGRVLVSARLASDNGIVLEVSDTGAGMSDGDIKQALEPFGRIGSPTAQDIEGTGLGLPLTQALVVEHGGTLDICSRVAQGTTVTVRFPAARTKIPLVVQQRRSASGLS